MTRKPKPPPVSDEFRFACHAQLDVILDTHPGTSAVLIGVDGGSGLEAVSIPGAFSVMGGMIRALFNKVYPE